MSQNAATPLLPKRRARRKPKAVDQVILHLPKEAPLVGVISLPVDLSILQRNWEGEFVVYQAALLKRQQHHSSSCIGRKITSQATHYLRESRNPEGLIRYSQRKLLTNPSLLEWTKWALTIVHHNPLRLVSLLTNTITEDVRVHKDTPTRRGSKRKRPSHSAPRIHHSAATHTKTTRHTAKAARTTATLPHSQTNSMQSQAPAPRPHQTETKKQRKGVHAPSKL